MDKLDELANLAFDFTDWFLAGRDGFKEELPRVDRMELRFEDRRVSVSSEKLQLRNLDLPRWVVLIAKVTVGTQRQKV